MNNIHMKPADLYRHKDEPTKSGAYGHKFSEPVKIWILINQRSDFYSSQGLERIESDHTGITREREIAHGDKIVQQETAFIVKNVKKNRRYTVLGLRRLEVESQRLY